MVAEKKEVAEEKEAERVHQAELAKQKADVARAAVPPPTTPAETLSQGKADADRVRTAAESQALGATPYTEPGKPRKSQHRTNELAAVQELIKEVGFGNLTNEQIVAKLKLIELSYQTL